MNYKMISHSTQSNFSQEKKRTINLLYEISCHIKDNLNNKNIYCQHLEIYIPTFTWAISQKRKHAEIW